MVDSSDMSIIGEHTIGYLMLSVKEETGRGERFLKGGGKFKFSPFGFLGDLNTITHLVEAENRVNRMRVDLLLRL